MPNADARLGCDAPASSAQPPHQLNLLVIEEEALVEETDFAQRVGPKHHAGAGGPVYLGSSLRIDRNRRNSKQPGNRSCARTARQLAADRWKAECAARPRSIQFQKLTANSCDARMNLKII